MPLPPPVSRQPSHTRTVVYHCFDRADGLWDIEAELQDIKSYTYQLFNDKKFQAGKPIHGLSIRLTIDSELVIVDVATSMDHIPHDTCSQAPANMHRLIGCKMGKGWRKQIEERVGGTEGCTHLREMLFNMATAAFQTLTAGEWHRRELKGLPHPVMTESPRFLDQCHTWDRSGTAAKQFFPMFYQPRSRERVPATLHPRMAPPADALQDRRVDSSEG